MTICGILAVALGVAVSGLLFGLLVALTCHEAWWIVANWRRERDLRRVSKVVMGVWDRKR